MRVVKTKQPIEINKQFGLSYPLYFALGDWFVGKLKADNGEEINGFVFQVKQYYKKDGQNVMLPPQNCMYKRSTFRSQFGNMTINDFIDQWPELMIQQMAYVNAKEFDGTEIQFMKFYGLGVDDFEIVEDGTISE